MFPSIFAFQAIEDKIQPCRASLRDLQQVCERCQRAITSTISKASSLITTFRLGPASEMVSQDGSSAASHFAHELTDCEKRQQWLSSLIVTGKQEFDQLRNAFQTHQNRQDAARSWLTEAVQTLQQHERSLESAVDIQRSLDQAEAENRRSLLQVINLLALFCRNCLKIVFATTLTLF